MKKSEWVADGLGSVRTLVAGIALRVRWYNGKNGTGYVASFLGQDIGKPVALDGMRAVELFKTKLEAQASAERVARRLLLQAVNDLATPRARSRARKP